MFEYAWLIPFVPALSFAVIVLGTNRYRALSAGIANVAIGAMCVWAWAIFINVWLNPEDVYHASMELINFGPSLTVHIGFQIDGLTAMMLIVVTTVSFMVHVYSIGYMHGETYFSRYFAFLSLFSAAMLGLVISDNYFTMFVCWELVGLTSYLLIGFYYHKQSASDAGKKAFITTRLGDLGFIVGLLIAYTACGTLSFTGIFEKVGTPEFSGAVVTLAAIFMFGGAVGKSAQFPLHVWLPDAMEGPTPVSALIHAATMVVAGVYLVARSLTVFAGSEAAMLVVATIGIITAVMAASIGLVQNDIKRVLAYSTVSQLGYMIMALGLAGFTASMFHLMTHAFFKSLLFLGAGSVIHAVHTNDIQEMGGLFGKMKTTAITFIIASLSIAGIFPLAGFWSKDEIIASTVGHPVFYVLTLVVAFMTAFYMFRLCFITFFGKPRDREKYDHAHESPKTMTVPLMILAVFSVIAGWVGIPGLHHGFGSVVFHGEAHHAHAHWDIMIISTLVAGAGIALAWFMYRKRTELPDKVATMFAPIYKLLYNKYYFDEIYQVVFVNPFYKLCRFLWRFDLGVVDGAVNGTAWLGLLISRVGLWFDLNIVDGLVNGTGIVVRAFGATIRFFQTGRLQNYALIIFAGLVILWILR